MSFTDAGLPVLTLTLPNGAVYLLKICCDLSRLSVAGSVGSPTSSSSDVASSVGPSMEPSYFLARNILRNLRDSEAELVPLPENGARIPAAERNVNSRRKIPREKRQELCHARSYHRFKYQKMLQKANKITPGNRKGKSPAAGGGFGGGPSPYPGGGEPSPQLSHNLAGGGGPAAPKGNSQQAISDEYVAKFDFEASKEDELTLTKGTRVRVLQMDGDGWWLVQNANTPSQQGWFPSNYVSKVNDVSSSREVPAAAGDDVVCVVRALYAFNSGNPEELAFESDEMLDITEQPPDDPEWWMARNRDGATGLVPKNYVEVAPDAKPVFNSNYDRVNSTPNGSSHNPDVTDGSSSDWFYGKISRVEAESLLTSRGQNGEFLVRDSETSSGFSISMKMPGRIRHFKVSNLPDGQLGIGQRKFDSMDQLLTHYKKAPIYTSPDQGKAYLTTPLSR